MSELETTVATFATHRFWPPSGRPAVGPCWLMVIRPLPQRCKKPSSPWQELGVPYEEATARTLLGQALRAAGDETGAIASFDAAASLFEQIGAQLDARQALGDNRPTLPAGLTVREAEVLRLVAGGLTNNKNSDRALPQPQDRVTTPVEHLHENRRVVTGERHRVRRGASPPRSKRRQPLVTPAYGGARFPQARLDRMRYSTMLSRARR